MTTISAPELIAAVFFVGWIFAVIALFAKHRSFLLDVPGGNPGVWQWLFICATTAAATTACIDFIHKLSSQVIDYGAAPIKAETFEIISAGSSVFLFLFGPFVWRQVSGLALVG